MTITTTQFESTHGRKPRGFGYWWFEMLLAGGESFIIPSYGTFRNALRSAQQRAQEQRLVVREIVVRP